MAASTRPLTLGEILDRTVQVYRRNFLLLVGIAILPSAIYVAVSGGAGILIASQMPGLQSGTPPTPQTMLILGLVGLLFLAVGLPILLTVAAVAMAALTFAARRIIQGESVTIREAFAYSFQLFWRNLGVLCLQSLFAFVIPTAVFSGLIVVGAIVATLVAGTGAATAVGIVMAILILLLVLAATVACCWIWLIVSLAFPATVCEGLKAWRSIVRSAQLSKGSRGRIFVMYLMVVILTFVAYYALTLPLDLVLKFTVYRSIPGMLLLSKPPVLMQIVNLLISCLERAFVAPIYAIALLLFYNDQRTRIEGYDIEQLMEQAGWANLPTAALPAASLPPPPQFSVSMPVSAPDRGPLRSPEIEWTSSDAPKSLEPQPEAGADSPRSGDPASDPGIAP